MPKDILIDDSGDLRIRGGDFAIGESADQHGKLLLETHPGGFRQEPLLGVGLSRYLLDDNGLAEIRHRTEIMVEYDSAMIESLEVSETEVNLVIYYP